MLINCQFHSAKMATNTNRHKFLEYNKLKASTLILHVTNRKATLCISYAFQKIAINIELENF